MSTTTIPDYSPGAIRALHRSHAVALRRVWVASVTLAACALAVLPWPLWALAAVWVGLVWYMVREPERPGYCE